MNAPMLRFVVGISASLIFAATGCGAPSDGLARVAVSGKVSLDGKPVEDGAITFLPTGDGPSAGARIQQGAYSIAQADGPVAAKYRVEIRSSKKTGKQIKDMDGAAGDMIDEVINDIPAAYNSRSTLEADVKAGEANELNYELDSKAGGGKRGRK